MKRIAYIIVLAFLASLFLPRCAVIVAPTGGDKDTIPPVMVRSVPALNSTNFDRDRVVITFDEFIRLEQITQKMVLSPPQEQLPEFKIRGKSLELRFTEPLLDSTTYTIYFADAILDNNEGNKLQNFEFSFATGSEIDSLRYIGKVINAFTLEPEEGVFVMFYKSHEDSIPILERPRYVTKSNKEGQFFLSNIKYGNYKLFALRDGNANYKFDQVSEEIAFSSSIIDTSLLLTPSQAMHQKDSLPELKLFLEEPRILALTDFSRNERRKLRLGFTKKSEGKVTLKPINVKIDSALVWYETGRNINADSLDFWIIDNNLSSLDTLVIGATYLKTDSLMNLVETTDTLRMFYRGKTQTTSRRARRENEDEKEEKIPTISVKQSIAKGASVIPNQRYTFRFNMPLQSFDQTKLLLMQLTDSSLIDISSFQRDSLNPTIYSFQHQWKPNVGYNFRAYPGAFVDLDGATNDTISVNFVGANPEDFGVLTVNLSGVNTNVIAEITTEKGLVVDSKVADTDGKLRFAYIKPGKYFLRFIIDENKNGKWDTGWYIKGIQPEKVIQYQDNSNIKEINIRANWDYDIDFKLN